MIKSHARIPGQPTSMNRSDPRHAARQPLPIHWLKPRAFKIPIPRDEKQRLAALGRYDILDTPPERTFDNIAMLASHVCATPIALLVLIDRNRQWFKAKVGVRVKETPRAFAFCTHTIMQRRLWVVSDVTRDRRFAANPFVVSGPHYRFYAGAPLVTPDNRALGTLCVIDKVVRTLTSAQKKDLLALSRLAMTELELRRRLRDERRTRRPRHRRRG
jgi:GAF domain-containing protein